jgi:hypothetical protein
MKKTDKFILKALVAAFILSNSFVKNSIAQQDNTIHLMPIVPQANYTNPAFQPIPTWYFGFPALSSVYAGIGHSGFAYRDLIKRRSDDSLELRMDHMVSKLGKRNYVSMNLMEEWLAFGFRYKKNYFNFSVSDKASFRFAYPRDLISLLWKGNGQFVGKTLDLSGIGVNASYYREYALGFSRDVKILKQDFIVGGRIKYLNGLMDVWTKKNNVTVQINEDDFAHTANTDFLVNMTIPDSIAMGLDSAGSDSSYFGGVDAKQFLFNNKNKGLGVDLGAYYKLNDKFSFGLSLLDFGYIHWKPGGGSSTRNYTSNVKDFTYDGIDVDQFFNEADTVVSQQMNQIGDSLANIFKINQSKDGYWAPLPTKIYMTGMYSLTPHDKVGLLIRSEFFNNGIHPSLTVSYNKWFFNMLSATASYSIMNRSYMNLGFGLALNLGPWQTYVTTDNLYCLFDPEGTRTVNLHFGVNFIFGYKEKKANESLYQDTPQTPKK